MGIDNIHFEKDTVRKTTIGAARVEAEKSRRAFEIGEQCSLFRVPKVLDCDEVGETILFERINDLHSLRDAVFRVRDRRDLMDRLGRSLAIIHRMLLLPDDMNVPLPPQFRSLEAGVFLHGDFNAFNVCLTMDPLTIVILDWQMSPLYGGVATYGTRFFDIMWFVESLLWQPSMRYLWGDPVGPLINSFLKAYFEEAGYQYEAAVFQEYASRFFSSVAPHRETAGRRTKSLFPRSRTLTRNFVASL